MKTSLANKISETYDDIMCDVSDKVSRNHVYWEKFSKP